MKWRAAGRDGTTSDCGLEGDADRNARSLIVAIWYYPLAAVDYALQAWRPRHEGHGQSSMACGWPVIESKKPDPSDDTRW